MCSTQHVLYLNMGLGAYLDLALIFLLFRFSLLILFFLHLALIALAHFWNNQVVTRRPKRLLLNTEVNTWI